MSAPKHTAGHWSVAATDDSLIVAGRTKIAATYEVEGDVWGGDNARLIAAAPDLLEAAREGLIVAEADVEEARRDCIEHGEDPEADQFVKVFTERRDLIRAAIAKATGADQ